MRRETNIIIKKFKKTFNFHEWLKQNFSLQYEYSIKQTSDKNKE